MAIALIVTSVAGALFITIMLSLAGKITEAELVRYRLLTAKLSARRNAELTRRLVEAYWAKHYPTTPAGVQSIDRLIDWVNQFVG